MSLPNYLAKIKSSGVYRFVWDKSEITPEAAETLRLVIGYSEKGPFNTPVYVENYNEFTTIFGNISKRLERRGVYFHRTAQHALQAGPILALNLKPFTTETVEYRNFNMNDSFSEENPTVEVKKLYDTNRFWALDPDQLPAKLPTASNYISIAATDTLENSCSVFIKKLVPESYKGITVETWYNMQALEMPDYLVAVKDKDISDFFAEVYVFRGNVSDKSMWQGATAPLANYLTGDEDGSNVQVRTDFVDAFGQPADALAAMSSDSRSNFIGVYSGCTIPYFKDANNNYIALDLLFNKDSVKHKMLMKMNESVLESIDNVLNTMTIEDSQTAVRPVYLKGYTYTSITKQMSNSALYNACVTSMLSSSDMPGLRLALTNRVDVEYHYLVDSFDAEVDPVDPNILPDSFIANTKTEFFSIAKEKDNAFAIVNFPKMIKFTKGNTYNMKGLKDAFGKYMPSEVDGASYGAYYTQLNFSDGTVKSTVPSAGLVSNLFINKWTSRQPYYIVAGPTYGRFNYNGLVGPDYNFSRSDLDVLEPMGVNAVVYVPRKGTYINSNQTAKQVPVSGLSKVHIRELVIYLQNEIENLLQSYQWELNTQTLRDTIKSKADAICENIKNNGGVYAYINVCDETNNTPEIIDNEMIILDTEIEPARGAGKMVHQLTIHKTGALTSKVK